MDQIRIKELRLKEREREIMDLDERVAMSKI
jgi:hypothetical protein